MRQLPLRYLVAAVALSAGCEPDRGAQMGDRGFELHDSGGVVVAHSRGPAWSESEQWRVADEPALHIATPVESSPSYILYQIGDIERLSDGRIVVENTGTRELLVFDEDGSFIEAWGGRGYGPTEFLLLRGMYGCSDDHIVQTEYHRATEFSPDGQIARREGLPWQSVELSSPTIYTDGVSPDCSSVLMTAWDFDWLPSSSTVGFASIIAEVSWTQGPDTPVDVLGRFPYVEQYKVDPLARSGIEFAAFTYAASLATHGGLLYFGLGDQAEIKVLGPTGDTARILRWDTPDSLITEAEWAEYSRDRDAFITDNPSRAGRYPTRRDHVSRTRKPLFATEQLLSNRRDYAFKFDDQGILWVRRYHRPSLSGRPEFEPPQRWWLFETDGRWLGEVVTPDNFRLRSIRGGHVFGVSTDEFDVEEVLAYRIVIPSKQPK